MRFEYDDDLPPGTWKGQRDQRKPVDFNNLRTLRAPPERSPWTRIARNAAWLWVLFGPM